MTGLELVEDDDESGLERENLPAVVGETAVIPAFIAAGGERAGYAFIDFFTAQIRNRNTRAAYAVAVRLFCSACLLLPPLLKRQPVAAQNCASS